MLDLVQGSDATILRYSASENARSVSNRTLPKTRSSIGWPERGAELLLIHGQPQRAAVRPPPRAADARGAHAHRLSGAAHAGRGGRRARKDDGLDARGGELGVRLRGA